MFTLTLVEHRDSPAFDNPEGEAFECFRFNFDTIDLDRIQQVIAILLQPPKRRRSDYGKPKPRPANGTQPELPTA